MLTLRHQQLPNLENTLIYAAGGAILGTGFYLYKEGYLNNLLTPVVEEPEPDTEPVPPGPGPDPAPGTSGTYTYWAKKKMQCRDNHLTFSYLAGYGVKILNWKLFNDGKIYAAACGQPSPYTILVAIDAADSSSAGKLRYLGFIQYFAPPSEPNPTVPIPNPQANVATTMAYVGEAPSHKAYKVFRHKREQW